MTMNPAQRTRRISHAAIRTGASVAAMSLALVLAGAARAQSFDATYDPAFPLGSAYIYTSPGGGTPATPPTTTIELYAPQTVIDWTPNDKTGTGTINFQPAGTTAIFRNGSDISLSDFTVLNRIIPTNTSGAAVSRAIAFNGTVQSGIYAFDGTSTPGGNVWFYSPTGIVVGSTAQFDVGSLVLTTNPVAFSDGNLFGPGGEIRFRGAAGSTGYVQIAPGALIATQINPYTLNDAYVALVAPRIEQGGTIAADGPAALVAAEQVDITINAGLFDIAVTQGTTDGNGIVHTGSTGGPTTVASGTVPQVALVAIPKNDGMTMLLSGTLGYTPATIASTDGGTVILSAGSGLGYGSTASAATGNIAIGNTVFTSALTASATDTISVTPTSLTQFNKAATLNARQTVNLTAANGAVIDAQYNLGLSLDVYAGTGTTGGAINVAASNGGAIGAQGRLRFNASGLGFAGLDGLAATDGTGGTIAIDINNASLSAALSLEIDTYGRGGDGYFGQGGSGTGGTIAINAVQGSITANSLDLYANGAGGYGSSDGGHGFGGSVTLTASQGSTLGFQSLYADASGSGGYTGAGLAGSGTGGSLDVALSGSSTLSAPFYASFNANGDGGYGEILGGDGIGGSVSLRETGGTFGFSDLFLSADGRGGSSQTAPGSAVGGSVLVSLAGSDQSWGSLYAYAIATAGEYYGTTIGVGGGNATANATDGVSLEIDGVSLAMTGDLYLTADAYGTINWDNTSLASGGRAALSVANGGTLTVDRSINVSASAYLNLGDISSPPTVTSSLQGGTAQFTVNGGSVTTAQLDVLAEALGMGGLMAAGNATGGSASAVVSNAGSLAIVYYGDGDPGTITVSAGAIGNYETYLGSGFGTVENGYAASARGGNALLQLDGGLISTVGDVVVEGSGIGGPAGIGTDGGAGTGGSARIAMSGGTFRPSGNVRVLAQGTGGTAALGGTAGTGTGGLAAFDATGGTATIGAGYLKISAQGLATDIATSATGSGGDAMGGTARLSTTGSASVTVGSFTEILAGATSGSASGTGHSAGRATGGTASIVAQGGTLTLAATQIDANARFGGGASGDGHTSAAGTARIEAIDGAITIADELTVSAFAERQSTLSAFAGVAAQGGTAGVYASGSGGLTVNGPTTITAAAYGGADSASGTDGGSAAGGTARVAMSNGGTARFAGPLTVTANAFGGTSTSAAGGAASGGSAMLAGTAGDVTVTGDALFTANGTGGTGPSDSGTATAGYVELAQGTIGGTLTASALGDNARADGTGLYLRLAGSNLTIAGGSTIETTGNVLFDITGGGMFTSGGTLSITTPASVTGTGSVGATGAATILADSGIAMAGLTSGGATMLHAVNGPVTVADLRSSGLVTVRGRSIGIASSGALSFADADATAGDLSIATTGGLQVATVDATGAVSLSSSDGALANTGAIHGTRITLTAAGGITSSGALASTGALDVTTPARFTASAPVTAAGAVSIVAGNGITIGSLDSGGATLLQAAGGAVTVSELLSAGLVTVLGQSVDITSSGALSFADADATGGSLAIDTAGDLSVATVNATGGLSLWSRTGTINASGAIDGAGVSLRAAGDITLSDTLISRDAVNNTDNTALVQVAAANPTTAGTLVVTTPGRFTAAAQVTAFGAVSILADSGIGMAGLDSGGTTLLQAINGPVSVSDLLSAAPVTVLGQFVDIASSGSLTFADADATAGDLAIAADGDLLVSTVDATGAVVLTSNGGNLTSTGAVNGTVLTLSAGNSVSAGAALTSASGITVQAGGMFALDAVATGSAIRVTSADIAIGSGGQLGVRGTTANVDLINSDTGSTARLGGSPATGGYNLDADEFTRVFADNGISYQMTGTGAADTLVDALSLTFGPSGNIGAGGTLALTSDGRIAIVGDVALAAASSSDTLEIVAPRLDIVADSGGLAMTDSAGAPLGRLHVNADVFAVATSDTLGLLNPSGNIGAANALLDTPGIAGSAATLAAGSIDVSVSGGFYVQNLGTSGTFADRRGFVTNALAITTGGPDTQIAINGLTLDATGNQVTGLDTAATIVINDLAATAAGDFDPNSTINGCVIGQSCIVTEIPEENDLPAKADLLPKVAPADPMGTLDIVVPPVELKENEGNPLLPLVDEPVTGVGNEDLWGNRCDPSADSCGNNGQ